MVRNVMMSTARFVLLFACAALSRADGQLLNRKPLGVYAHVSIEDAINRKPCSRSTTTEQVHACLRRLYTRLLADSAVSGITAGMRWDNIQLSDPPCLVNNTCPSTADGYDWSYLDDVFAEATAANKSVQLIITPGVDAPHWLLSKIPSCDSLFRPGPGTARADCGKVTFSIFPEQVRADGNVLPLPWNGIYTAAWWDFLVHLRDKYGSNAAFVAIAVAGPICASTEFILPTSSNNSFQQPGLSADSAWSTLINHSFPTNTGYQNTDQVFIDQWERTIDKYQQTFSGVTLILSPDAGQDLPEFATQNSGPPIVHTDNVLWDTDCKGPTRDVDPRSCEAKTEILSYFITSAGSNSKATQVGGMTASGPDTTGNIGLPGVRLLTSRQMGTSHPFLGGAEFDFPVSDTSSRQKEGCGRFPVTCDSLPVEQAAYNVLGAFFHGTSAASYYDGTSGGTAPMRYVALDYVDIRYAQKHLCPKHASTIADHPSLQDLLNRARYDLFQMAGRQAVLPAHTCHH